MPETIRTVAELLAILADSQPAHATNRERLRDMVVSLDSITSLGVAAETANRIADVNAEEASRIGADATLQTNIDNEATARIAGDAATLASAEDYADAGDLASIGTANDYTDDELLNVQRYPVLGGEVGVVNLGYPYGDVRRYGAVTGGVVDNRTAFYNACNSGVAKVTVPAGRYLFTITGDSTSITLPSNLTIECEPGTIFEWSYLGSPLFVAVDREDIRIDGPIFEWNGTLADIAGSNAGRFGWSGTTAANRDFCAHVLSLGSSNVKIRNAKCRTKGDNPTLATQCFAIFAGFFPNENNTTRTRNNAVEDCETDDVVMGVLYAGQDSFRARNITSRRFPGEHGWGSAAGINGHVVYATDAGPGSRDSVTENITDHGVAVGTITGRSDSSVQLKEVDNPVIRGITSKRPTGILSLFGMRYGVLDGAVWSPATVESNGMNSGLVGTVGLEDSVLKGMVFILPDNTNSSAWNLTDARRCQVEAYISAAHTSTSIPSSVFTTCIDNKIKIDYLARNTTTAIPLTINTASHRNQVSVTPLGQNHALRPNIATGCTGNIIRLVDSVDAKWSNLSFWGTESDSPAMGYEPIRKSKAYRIGTSTDPTTTFQLPRPGVYMGTVQIIESTGAHLRGGVYRIAYDSGTLQSVELIGTQWTKGASTPTALSLAVAATGVVTVTTTAGSAAWDIVYDFESLGNNRYADY